MEKERYVVMENFGRYIFHDTLCDKYYSVLGKNNAQNLVTLLNQQDTRIKELEEENQQLKEENNFLEKINEELTIDRRDFCLERNDLFEENQQLKQLQTKRRL